MTAGNFLVGILIVATAMVHQNAIAENSKSLNGAWRMVDSKIITPNGDQIPGKTWESFLLFADGYYSMNWSTGNSSEHFFEKRFMPSDSEKIMRFAFLIVNAGRYETSDGVLTIQPDFALVPEYVGGIGVFDYKLSGDTLDLEWRTITSVDGVNDPNTDQGVRFHYRWVRR